jgi:hypothetical protein
MFASGKPCTSVRREEVVEVVVDFGLSRISVRVMGKEVVFPEGLTIPLDYLSSLSENFAYKLINGSIQRLDLFSEGKYYEVKTCCSNSTTNTGDKRCSDA